MRYPCNFTSNATSQGRSIYLPLVINRSHELFLKNSSEEKVVAPCITIDKKMKNKQHLANNLLLGNLIKKPFSREKERHLLNTILFNNNYQLN